MTFVLVKGRIFIFMIIENNNSRKIDSKKLKKKLFRILEDLGFDIFFFKSLKTLEVLDANFSLMTAQ